MSKQHLESLIGKRLRPIHKGEMGGVISVLVTRASNDVLLDKLTPQEGLRVFQWAIKEERRIEKRTRPEDWESIRRDSMNHTLLRDRGVEWFKEFINSNAVELRQTKPY